MCWRSTVDLCQFSVSRYRSRTRPAVELADFPPSAATQQNTANDFKGKLEVKNDSSLIYIFIFRISFQFIHLFYFLILVHFSSLTRQAFSLCVCFFFFRSLSEKKINNKQKKGVHTGFDLSPVGGAEGVRNVSFMSVSLW